MEKYRKKPVVIEAIQFKNSNHEEIEQFVGKKLRSEVESEETPKAGTSAPVLSIIIPTLEGDMKAMPNDFIIKGVHGECYPCKPDIFEKTYEKVENV